jgi:hypothetical protein
MSQKLLVVLAVVFMSSVLFLTGCTPEVKESAQIALKLTSGDSSVYKVAFETIQDYKFDQPSIDKVKIEQNFTRVETTFLQEINSINGNSTASATITLKRIAVLMKDREGVKLDFDSTRPEDKKKPLSGLVGKSYLINITSDGKVSVVDAANIRKVAIKSMEGRIAANLLTDAEIIKRHEVIALPGKDASILQEGATWSKVVASHPKLLEQKSFEKTYTLEEVGSGNVAKVSMNAYQSDKSTEGPVSKNQFGPMAKMFDTQEKFSGEMKIDLESGKVIDLNEEFIATYIATDASGNKLENGPDVLTMGLTHSISIEKIE